MSHTPTAQQQALYEAVTGTTSHLIAIARAGAGKTTTAVQCAGLATGKVGFLAFNRHIALELRERLQGSAKACTLHSLGYAACRKALGNVQVDEAKPRRLLERLHPEWTFRGPRGAFKLREEGQATLALARLVKATLANEQDADRLAELAHHYGVELPADPEPVFAAVAELIAATLEDTRNLDYDDQVWLPCRLSLPVERFDLLMVDEAQDLNVCQQRLATLAAQDGRLVVIGDPRQAIYGFSGSDTQSIARLQDQLRGMPRDCLERPLTVTFRCPVSHVHLAKRLVPDLEAAATAAEGVITNLEEGNLARYLTPGDLVIARRNAPLMSLAFRLISDNMPVLVRGREIGTGLLSLMEDLQASDLVELLTELETYRVCQLERLERKDAPESAFQSLQDRCDCLKELASSASSVPHLQETIRRLFADSAPAGKVILSSVHRAKGLEAERVVIIDTESLPLVRTCRACRGSGCPKCGMRGTRSPPWEIEQELNLLYVAVTRAKKELVFAGPVPPILGGNWT